jgi:hypothetical protein
VLLVGIWGIKTSLAISGDDAQADSLVQLCLALLSESLRF